ncbi:hypothetical protein DENSPDRAFT_842107 [Dentipellis sp. KUC8613]|nr:hypothetical protein DENSPDRAFT_842107 [Dentipellis sp. KUC8613]
MRTEERTHWSCITLSATPRQARDCSPSATAKIPGAQIRGPAYRTRRLMHGRESYTPIRCKVKLATQSSRNTYAYR